MTWKTETAPCDCVLTLKLPDMAQPVVFPGRPAANELHWLTLVVGYTPLLEAALGLTQLIPVHAGAAAGATVVVVVAGATVVVVVAGATAVVVVVVFTAVVYANAAENKAAMMKLLITLKKYYNVLFFRISY